MFPFKNEKNHNSTIKCISCYRDTNSLSIQFHSYFSWTEDYMHILTCSNNLYGNNKSTHRKNALHYTCKGSFSSVEPSISFTRSWHSSGLPNVKHFSTTLEANFCWLIFTICPASWLMIVDLSCGLPCSRTC